MILGKIYSSFDYHLILGDWWFKPYQSLQIGCNGDVTGFTFFFFWSRVFLVFSRSNAISVKSVSSRSSVISVFSRSSAISVFPRSNAISVPCRSNAISVSSRSNFFLVSSRSDVMSIFPRSYCVLVFIISLEFLVPWTADLIRSKNTKRATIEIIANCISIKWRSS